MEQVRTQVFNIADLNPAKYNPRKALQPGDPEFEALCRSIETFGYVDLVVVNIRDGTNVIVSGHQRISAMKYLGETTAECVVVDLDEPSEKALNVAMNKISGEWDVEKLKELLKDIDLSGLDMALTGFSDEELEGLIGEVDLGGEEDFDVDEELAKPVYSKPGDIWHLGPHRVICGDSTLPETYQRLMGEEKAALILTDLPYNVNVEKTAGKIMNDNMSDSDFYKFVLAAYKAMHEPLAEDGTIYVWHADGNGLIFRKAFEEAGFTFLQCAIWQKDTLVLGRSPFQWIHEPCLVGSKGGEIHFYGSEEGSVWHFDRPKKSELHPTTKPVLLIAYQVRNSTQEGDVVLDPFLGSGTTLIACAETGRVCYANELDPKFVDVEVERYISWSGGFADVYVERDGETIPYADVPKPQ